MPSTLQGPLIAGSLRKLQRVAVLVNPTNLKNAETTLGEVAAAEAQMVGLQIPDPESRHPARDRCGLREYRARPPRRTFRR